MAATLCEQRQGARTIRSSFRRRLTADRHVFESAFVTRYGRQLSYFSNRCPQFQAYETFPLSFRRRPESLLNGDKGHPTFTARCQRDDQLRCFRARPAFAGMKTAGADISSRGGGLRTVPPCAARPSTLKHGFIPDSGGSTVGDFRSYLHGQHGYADLRQQPGLEVGILVVADLFAHHWMR